MRKRLASPAWPPARPPEEIDVCRAAKSCPRDPTCLSAAMQPLPKCCRQKSWGRIPLMGGWVREGQTIESGAAVSCCTGAAPRRYDLAPWRRWTFFAVLEDFRSAWAQRASPLSEQSSESLFSAKHFQGFTVRRNCCKLTSSRSTSRNTPAWICWLVVRHVNRSQAAACGSPARTLVT